MAGRNQYIGGVPPRTTTILLVDPNAGDRNRLAASLVSTRGFVVQEAADTTAALTCLNQTLVDLVITELRLPGEDGCELLELIRDVTHPGALPVLFLSYASRVQDKVRALEAGAQDYITKPVVLAELYARIDSVLRRQASRIHRVSRARSYNFAGDFSCVAFSEVVGMLQHGHHSGRLSIFTPCASGELLFVEGMVYDATFGSLHGENAFYRIMHEHRGQYTFEPREFDLASVRNTIAISPTALLMEGSRQVDTWIREHGDAEPLSPDDLSLVATGLTTEIKETPALDPEQIQALEQAIRDPEHKGQLHLIPRAELSAWNDAPEGEARYRVLLVANPSEAVEALAEVSLPLSETQIEATLELGLRILGLTFEVGSNRLDVLLLDEKSPALLLDELHEQPAVLVFAPSDGDGMSLGLHSLAELESVFLRLDPRAVLCLGQPSAELALRSVAERAGCSPQIHCMPESPAALRDGFRECLSAALQLSESPSLATPTT